MRRSRLFLLCLALSVLVGCVGGQEPITGCEAMGNATPLCGYQNPEDLALLPGGRFVVVSEYGAMDGSRAGSLSLLDLETDARTVLYDGGGPAADELWGDEDCIGQVGDAFSPHGLHLSQRTDGAWQLLVVQHGARESVELFEVGQDPVSLTWRGCVEGPEGSMFNDVAGTAEGALYVTHMMPNQNMTLSMIGYLWSSATGAPTGYALRWSRAEGMVRVVGSDGIIPNGIEISADERTLLVNLSGGEVRVLDIDTFAIRRSIALDPPDNSTWAPDGRLLVAVARGDTMDAMACMDLEEGQCPVAYAIVAVDIDTGATEDLYVGGPGTPGGGGTVGLLLDDGRLLVGTFAGDRIMRIDLSRQTGTIAGAPSGG